MTDGVHSVNTCGQLHQLQVWKLLQHGDSGVFQEGLNREPEALQFSLQELSLWNATSLDGPSWDLPMIEVVLSSVESETASLTQVPPPPSHQSSMWCCHSSEPTPQPPPTSIAYLGGSCHLQPWAPHPPPEQKIHSAWRRWTWPSLFLWLPLHRHHLGEAMPECIANNVQVSHSPSLPTISKLWMWPASPPVYSLEPPRTNPTCLPNEVLWLQREMNAALEWLPMTKATLNSHQRELAWNVDVTMCQNETQATKAIKEAEVQCVATVREAEAQCAAMIREAETHFTAAIKEAETHYTAMIREAETHQRAVFLGGSPHWSCD